MGKNSLRASTLTARRGTHPFTLILLFMQNNLRWQLGNLAPLMISMSLSLLSNTLFLVFWSLLLTSFRDVAGFTRSDVLILWSVTTTGIGSVFFVGGALPELAQSIRTGQLDSYLLLPRRPLLPLLLSSTDTAYSGDVLFGVITFIAFGHPSLERTGTFMVAVAVTGGIILGFMLTAACTAFIIERADLVVGQMLSAFIQLLTSPGTIFKGAIAVVLFTVMPAGFINLIPIEGFRRSDFTFLGIGFAVAFGWVILGRFLFYRGLRRYVSGSVINVRP